MLGIVQTSLVSVAYSLAPYALALDVDVVPNRNSTTSPPADIT